MADIPQDLLLIQELVGPVQQLAVETPVDVKVESDADDIGSSDAESDVEKGPRSKPAETQPPSEPTAAPDTSSSSSSSSSSESESDSDSDSDDQPQKATKNDDLDDDEDPVPPTTGTYFQTKHEVLQTEITVPEIDQVEDTDVLEKVGEIMNIIDQTVIVRGAPSDHISRGSEKALDSDTLLVFDDRKVFGYIYETFGPTTQPLYQVKFNAKFPLDPERVKQGRDVFHVPARSKFVFMKQIRAFKGSDASNVYDEEPAEDEVEFSDDEAEAAYRSRLKRKRTEARNARNASQAPDPNPSAMRDQDLEYLNRSAFDANGPYDIDFSAPGPSRPPPVAYDDPYADYPGDLADTEDSSNARGPPSKQQNRGGGGGRGRGDGHRRGRGNRGGGGGGGRGRPHHAGHQDRPSHQQQQQQHPHSTLPPSNFTPPYQSQFPYPQQQQQPPSSTVQPYVQPQSFGYPSYQNQAQFGFTPPGMAPAYPTPGAQMPFMPPQFLQPHINPRFASMWGMAPGMSGMRMPGMPMGSMGIGQMPNMNMGGMGMGGMSGMSSPSANGQQQQPLISTTSTSALSTPSVTQPTQLERSQDTTPFQGEK